MEENEKFMEKMSSNHAINRDLFKEKAKKTKEGDERAGFLFRKSTDLVPSTPFDYSKARKWAPNADFNDLETFYPSEIEKYGVRPQAEIWELYEKYLDLWQKAMPTSKKMQDAGRKNMMWGIFGAFQKDWETPILPFVESCMDGRLTDVDGKEYIDIQFGDTPCMFGYGPKNPAIKAAADSLMTMGVSPYMGEKNQAIAATELEKHFKLPIWMHALTATDANRYSISIARTVTGRRNVAIPNFTYHGTLEVTQKIMPEPGVIARFHEMPQYFADVDHGTKIFTWNDLESVEECLKDRTIAVLLLEPIMSNFGWAWPDEGFLEGVRKLTKKYGTLLCYDETHTLSYDWNGYCGAHDLDYDMWTCGKAISSGIPGAVFGMTREIGDLIQEWHNEAGFFAGAGLGFLGNVLTGNTLSTVALKVTLEELLTPEVYTHLKGLGAYVRQAMEDIHTKYSAPFRAEQMGNRICYHFIEDAATEPLAGLTQVAFGGLYEFSHAYLWHRGLLIMPYFNMFMVCPQHTTDDMDKFIEVYDDMIAIIMGQKEG